ncbi:MAG: sodium/glutamate symporter [candidate division KSB1 bacterium]|nr:sodium/glutamate symporter [candidate division KSB1 bacterium]MDZ7275426.1 sodium/glutamate symporter [candidate division KSB1 bacterium]MDZ7286262.1 sodium/glutamate symporter [candidate division KSB1 bacterium]MDZ7296488.1 sodium/glutamate symporter [candidate division KSB1 bacterium]MDZ7305554.1 sodium/glutamate symporter [candidate division KSB1 bacterium]
MLKLDLIQTLAFAGLALYLGHFLRRLVPVLARYNLPAPVLGGLLVAGIVTAGRRFDMTFFAFDTTLQSPLMIAFFTAIGFGASLALLKRGGPQVLILFLCATLGAVVQNLLGMALAKPLGIHPLIGVISGSLTLAGGPATGLAFAPLFEQAGIPGAATIAIAAAMAGIIAASVLGGPLATLLIERFQLKPNPRSHENEAVLQPEAPAPARGAAQNTEAAVLLKSVTLLLVVMWLGAWLSAGLKAMGVTLPAYIGAMVVAALVRNLDDATGKFGLPHRTVEALGTAALTLFIVLALMTLKLWELAGLALPLLVILAAQVAMMALVCLWPMFRLLGHDYDAAVMVSGFCGFMLGTTANAMANMEALVERYGPAPRAFLVVPMIGAFFIDFSNALLLTACVNLFK